MDFQSVKGFRDLYPDDMAVRNYILGAWRKVSVRNGFVEYESPILEYLDLYRAKSGDEIVSQLFSLTDRGGRELAIRPEITPSLARMINARIHSLPRPIKWFSIPRVCRAENPQRGRLREFFQWNVDVVGADEPLADAECIFTLVDLLAEVGLTPGEAVVSLSSRGLIAAGLEAVGVGPERHDAILPILDKRDKVPHEAFEEMAAKAGLTAEQIRKLAEFQDAASLEEAVARIGHTPAVLAERDRMGKVLEILSVMGAKPFIQFNLHIVRGLAYYTGVVYEAFDAAGSMRALAGGGRYDNLLEVLGGPKLGATGFGMGDVVLGILLAEKAKLPQAAPQVDGFVIDAGPEYFGAALAIVAELRRAGLQVGMSYKRRGLGKQLKAANQCGARKAVIVGEEFSAGAHVVVKDLASGEQTLVARGGLAAALKK